MEQVSVFITRWEQKFDKTVAVELEIWLVVQLKADFEKGILAPKLGVISWVKP